MLDFHKDNTDLYKISFKKILPTNILTYFVDNNNHGTVVCTETTPHIECYIHQF